MSPEPKSCPEALSACLVSLRQVCDDELFPADLVCLASALPDSVAFIKTTNLDGENNLKIRRHAPLRRSFAPTTPHRTSVAPWRDERRCQPCWFDSLPLRFERNMCRLARLAVPLKLMAGGDMALIRTLNVKSLIFNAAVSTHWLTALDHSLALSSFEAEPNLGLML